MIYGVQSEKSLGAVGVAFTDPICYSTYWIQLSSIARHVYFKVLVKVISLWAGKTQDIEVHGSDYEILIIT